MLYEQFTDNGDILVNNPNIHNLEKNHGLSTISGLQHLNAHRFEISISQVTMDLLLFTYIFSFLIQEKQTKKMSNTDTIIQNALNTGAREG
jgi:hypothetical protein